MKEQWVASLATWRAAMAPVGHRFFEGAPVYWEGHILGYRSA